MEYTFGLTNYKEKGKIEDEPTSPTLQELPLTESLRAVEELPLTESLRAVETLYNLALFRSYEPEFSGFFHTLLNVRSHLKAKQRNTLRSSKITAYFQTRKQKKRGQQIVGPMAVR